MARSDSRGSKVEKVTIAEADAKESAMRNANQFRQAPYYAGDKNCDTMGMSPLKLTPRQKLEMDKERLRFHIDDMDRQIVEINRKLTLLNTNPDLEKLAEILQF